MLTATEIQHLKSVIKDLMEVSEYDPHPLHEEAGQALEILDKLKPLDLKTIETIVSEGEE